MPWFTNERAQDTFVGSIAMAVYVAFSSAVLIMVFLRRSIAAPSGSCGNGVVHINATLEPGWKYEIQSPGFPNNYPANTTCTWRVTLSDSLPRYMYGIGLMADTWEIETCTDCSCDYVTYGQTKWDVTSAYRRERKCNIFSENYLSLLATHGQFFITVSTREAWLKFHSDGSSQFKGFKGQLRVYNAIDNRCNNFINDTNGVIASPKFPSHYPKGQAITWCLAVPQGFRVKLKFSAFELEDTRNKDRDCVNDFVEIRDGGKGAAARGDWNFGELLGRFCGNTMPKEEIISKSNKMWVLFVSDNNATTVYKGFRAEFASGSDIMKSSILAWVLGTAIWWIT